MGNIFNFVINNVAGAIFGITIGGSVSYLIARIKKLKVRKEWEQILDTISKMPVELSNKNQKRIMDLLHSLGFSDKTILITAGHYRTAFLRFINLLLEKEVYKKKKEQIFQKFVKILGCSEEEVESYLIGKTRISDQKRDELLKYYDNLIATYKIDPSKYKFK